MPEMRISRARIDPELHAQWTTERKFLLQLGLAAYFGGTLFEGGESFSRLHGAIVQRRRARCYLFLLSNSRTSSMVNGLFCRLNAFWLLPRSRNGRFSAYSRPLTFLSALTAPRIPVAVCVP